MHDIHVMGIPEGEERAKGTEEIFKTIMTENFLRLMPDIKPQIQETQRTSKCQKITYRNIIFKLQKIIDKEKNPKRYQREKLPPVEEQR